MIPCFNIVSMVIDEKTEVLGDKVKISDYKLYQVKNICSVFDALYKERGAVSFDVDIDDESLQLILTAGFQTGSREVRIPYDVFFGFGEELIIGYDADEEVIRFGIVLPSIWNTADE